MGCSSDNSCLDGSNGDDFCHLRRIVAGRSRGEMFLQNGDSKILATSSVFRLVSATALVKPFTLVTSFFYIERISQIAVTGVGRKNQYSFMNYFYLRRRNWPAQANASCFATEKGQPKRVSQQKKYWGGSSEKWSFFGVYHARRVVGTVGLLLANQRLGPSPQRLPLDDLGRDHAHLHSSGSWFKTVHHEHARTMKDLPQELSSCVTKGIDLGVK